MEQTGLMISPHRKPSGSCGGRKHPRKGPVPGKTDLVSRAPALGKDWCWEKNGAINPRELSYGSKKKVWWKCEKGHIYQASVMSRMQGSACPYCAGRRAWPGFNDLATTHPKVAAQWYAPLNGALTPEQVTRGSHKRVWWQCPEGHVWRAAVFSRTREMAAGCPVCARTVRGPARKSGAPNQQQGGTRN